MVEVLTVLDAQDDVSEVEPRLVLAEGLLAGHLHHRPVGRREGSKSFAKWQQHSLLGF